MRNTRKLITCPDGVAGKQHRRMRIQTVWLHDLPLKHYPTPCQGMGTGNERQLLCMDAYLRPTQVTKQGRRALGWNSRFPKRQWVVEVWEVRTPGRGRGGAPFQMHKVRRRQQFALPGWRWDGEGQQGQRAACEAGTLESRETGH